ncbi:MAG: extensin family protein [Rhodobacteraceae bacterium]|nr:extensin family protein [Paracoccaceae bacterium]
MRAARALLLVVAALALALPTLAGAPDRSLRPELRPGGAAQGAAQGAAPGAAPGTAPGDPPGVTRVVITATPFAPRASLRPLRRDGAEPPAPVAGTVAAPTAQTSPEVDMAGLFTGTTPPATVTPGGTALATPVSLRPYLRPPGLEQRVRAVAARQTPSRVAQSGQRGALCGQPGLVGDRLEPITGRISGCGIAEPVRLRAVDGIALTTPATINCATAEALQSWVQRTVIPEVGRRGGGVENLRVVASYACRTRNSQAGARLSEHATGNAIDIAAIGLVNGTEISVLRDWGNGREGRILQSLHRGACGTFGTVLGPNSDRFHRDHFHFDTASYRSGPYCR